MTEDKKITEVRAPMVGKITQVKVKPGDKVSQNDVLMTFESMKIEMKVSAPVAGTIKEVKVSAEQTIEADTVLATIEPRT